MLARALAVSQSDSTDQHDDETLASKDSGLLRSPLGVDAGLCTRFEGVWPLIGGGPAHRLEGPRGGRNVRERFAGMAYMGGRRCRGPRLAASVLGSASRRTR